MHVGNDSLDYLAWDGGCAATILALVADGWVSYGWMDGRTSLSARLFDHIPSRCSCFLDAYPGDHGPPDVHSVKVGTKAVWEGIPPTGQARAVHSVGHIVGPAAHMHPSHNASILASDGAVP